MKPCAKNKQPLSLLAVDELAPRPAAELRAHMTTCPGCRDYFDEISKVAGGLTAAKAALPEIETSELFHRRLTQRIKAEEQPGAWAAWLPLARSRGLNWQFAAPLIVVGVVAALLLITRQNHPSAPTAIASNSNPAPMPAAVSPTFGNYRMLADRSFEALDQELSREAAAAPASAPVYTVASITRTMGLD